MSTPDDGTRWLGYTHEQIYAMVHGGAGPGAGQAAEAYWRSTGEVLATIDSRIGAALRAAGTGWEGAAAQATTAGAAPLAAWARERAALAGAAAATLAAQGRYADHVLREMPAPAPPAGPEVAALGPSPDLLSDWSAADRAQRNAAERAVEIMNSYTYNSYDTLPGMEIGTPPPQVVLADGPAVASAGSPHVDPLAIAATAAPAPVAGDGVGGGSPIPLIAGGAGAAVGVGAVAFAARRVPSAPVPAAHDSGGGGPDRGRASGGEPGTGPERGPARAGAPDVALDPHSPSRAPSTTASGAPVVGRPTGRAAAPPTRVGAHVRAPEPVGALPPEGAAAPLPAGPPAPSRPQPSPPAGRPAEPHRPAPPPPHPAQSDVDEAGSAYVPPMVEAERRPERRRRRPDYLMTPDAFADDRVVTDGVITPDREEIHHG